MSDPLLATSKWGHFTVVSIINRKHNQHISAHPWYDPMR